MNKYHNEQGAALVMTLLFITVLILLLLGQFYQVTNTAGQVSTMEKSIEARHMADMGIDYYQQMVASKREILEEVAEDSGFQGVKSAIEELNNTETLNSEMGSGNKSFEIEQITIEQTSDDEITIQFNSKGMASEKEINEESEIIISILRQ
ncbi:hypothetical protein ACLIBG_03590 [Virgibacillus sp. W0181]|uniref:hypothetical protein n=1 Tax=Virgibacillus sp. W0181 TaxID=3391581 RepID=UPI003F4700B9